jgi:hypothetical protein
MESLIALAILLIAVTLIGHGIWVLAAMLLRAFSEAAESAREEKSCQRCGRRLAEIDVACSSCGLVATGARAAELEELASAIRQIRRLQDRGDLDTETALRVAQILQERRRSVLTPIVQPVRPVAASAPERPTPAPPPVFVPAEERILDVLPVEEKPPLPIPERAPPPPLPFPVAPLFPAVRLPRPEPTPPPPEPRRTLADVMAAFMEERNILWGELIGGMLIVGCSVALVISLWQSLDALPYFPFLLFSAITAAIFGAGEYTLRHWKLEATSRGLLIISLLLTPLNLLVLGDPTAVGRSGIDAAASTWIIDLAVKVTALLGFTSLARIGGRDLLSVDLAGRAWLTMLGVVGAVAVPLIGSSFLNLNNPIYILLFGSIPCLTQVIALDAASAIGSRHPRTGFSLLGLASFATVVTLGFLVSRCADVHAALQFLAMMLPVAGTIVLTAGLHLQRQLSESDSTARGGWLTVATAVTGVGLVVQLAAMPLAWPATNSLLVASLANSVLLSLLAFRARRPSLHAAALPCAALFVVLAYHQLAGHLPAENLAALLAAPESGAALAGCSVAFAAVGEGLIRRGRAKDGGAYASAALGAGLFALLAATAAANSRPALAAAVYAMCATTALAWNFRWRRPVLEYTGLGLAVAASFWVMQSIWPGDWVTVPAEANAGNVVSSVIDANWPVRAFIIALEAAIFAFGNLHVNLARSGRAWRDLAVVTGILSIGLMASHRVVPEWYAASYLALAASTFFLALASRSPAWFALCQIAVTFADLFAVNAWLKTQEWLQVPADPRALQAYGLGLAILAFGWVVARIALRSSRLAADIGLLGFTFDRFVLGALVLGQFLLVLGGVLPGIAAEMSTSRSQALSTILQHSYGPAAIALLGVLTGVVSVSLWDRARTRSVVGLTILAFTIPLLIAGPFSAELATATALRWALAACFVAVSSALWARRYLANLATAVGIGPHPGMLAVVSVHGLLGVAVAVVLGLTAWLAVIGFSGQAPAGPLPESFFARIGWTMAFVAPLVLLVIGLTGHAVRERSPGYAFFAGLIADVALAGGYALGVVSAGGTLGEIEIVRVGQLATLSAAAWGLIWMLCRRWLYGRVLERVGLVLEGSARPLLALQSALAIGGNLVLFGGAVAVRGNVLVDPQAWSIEAGSLLAATTLLTALVTFAVWQWQRDELLSWQAPFFIGLTLPAFLACTAERSLEGSGFRVLLLAWPGYILLWSLSVLRPGLRKRLLPRVAFNDDELPVAALLASVFTLIVAAKTVTVLDLYLPAALASGITTLVFAVLATARRLEVLAFIASLLGNATVSLFVAQYYHDRDFALWALPLVRANVVASAAAALAWLALHRRLNPLERPGPLLALQAFLGLWTNSILLAVPVAYLFADPGTPLPGWLQPELPVSGWPALLAAALAAYLYRRETAPGARIHVLGVVAFSVAALLASAVSPADSGDWLSYHVLTAALATFAVIGVVAGPVLTAIRGYRGSTDTRVTLTPSLPLFHEQGLRGWIEIACGTLAVLAIRGPWNDPYEPYPSALTMLLVSVVTGVLAIRFRNGHHVWASGLAMNLSGIIIWMAWGSEMAWDSDSIISVGSGFTNVIGLATAGAIWTGVGLVMSNIGRPINYETSSFFPRDSVAAAWLLLLFLTVSSLVTDLAGVSAELSQLACPAVGCVAAALAVALWEKTSSGVAPAFYGLGLIAAGTLLHSFQLAPLDLTRAGTLALAGYVLFAGLVCREMTSRLLDSLRLPLRDGRWFAPAQTTLAVLVALLGVYVSVGYPTLNERLGGALAAGLTVPALALLGISSWRRTLALAAIALAEVALAIPDPMGIAPALHRTALLVAAFSIIHLLYSEALPRWLAAESRRIVEARRSGATCAVLAVASLLALMAQEFNRFDALANRTTMELYGILLIPLCVAWLIVTTVRCALEPGRDLLGLPERGRTIYVYAAEALLLLMLVHLRLTAPELFSGWVARYWTLVVMLLGFAGMAAGEYLERKGRWILAEPLLRTGLVLPIVPLVAYWIKLPLAPAGAFPQDLGQYAVLWVLVALLLGVAASLRRSHPLGFLSALALNFGVWSILAHGGVAFASHPQLWLIPLALIVLVAEHLNRERLSADLAASLRYLGICTVYVSSTADLFIAGLGNSVLLPVALAILAIAGVLSGISLRVRAFLFMGVSFLLLDIFTMIWHAAVDRYHTWVWWVSGIVLGASILALFAVFEKRRNDVLLLIDHIKRWD